MASVSCSFEALVALLLALILPMFAGQPPYWGCSVRPAGKKWGSHLSHLSSSAEARWPCGGQPEAVGLAAATPCSALVLVTAENTMYACGSQLLWTVLGFLSDSRLRRTLRLAIDASSTDEHAGPAMPMAQCCGGLACPAWPFDSSFVPKPSLSYLNSVSPECCNCPCGLLGRPELPPACCCHTTRPLAALLRSTGIIRNILKALPLCASTVAIHQHLQGPSSAGWPILRWQNRNETVLLLCVQALPHLQEPPSS